MAAGTIVLAGAAAIAVALLLRELFRSNCSPDLHTLHSHCHHTQATGDAEASWQNGRYNTDPRNSGWTLVGVIEHLKLAMFERNGVKMDYWYSTGTVRTVMKHPKRGWTQLFRQNLSEEQFQALLKNPRVHTNQGYYTKAGRFQKLFERVVQSIAGSQHQAPVA